MNLHFLIIDPQNDFADPRGSLFVPGADKDLERLAIFLERHLTQVSAIHVTLDTHHWVDIAHPIFWQDSQGNSPKPFTVITEEAVLTGQWRTRQPHYQARAVEYVKSLRINGRYQLTIWPPHCLIGKPGHNVVPPLAEILTAWEDTFAMVDYVMKGSNCWTEHYSALKAELPDLDDPHTLLNTSLINELKSADLVVCSGQALSHCVANTLRDLVANLDPADISKFVLIADTTSPVPGFEKLAQQFLTEMATWGIRTVKSTEFLV
jgi:nicotinamidase-related amidase